MNQGQREKFRKFREKIKKDHGQKFYEKLTYRRTHSIPEQEEHLLSEMSSQPMKTEPDKNKKKK